MLPAEQRLRQNRDFRLAYARGRNFGNKNIVLTVYRRSAAHAVPGRRVGFVVSKKQGDAVRRNRIKRRLREAMRLRLPALREGPFDLIFIGKAPLLELTWQQVQDSVDELLRRANLLNRV